MDADERSFQLARAVIRMSDRIFADTHPLGSDSIDAVRELVQRFNLSDDAVDVLLGMHAAIVARNAPRATEDDRVRALEQQLTAAREQLQRIGRKAFWAANKPPEES